MPARVSHRPSRVATEGSVSTDFGWFIRARCIIALPRNILSNYASSPALHPTGRSFHFTHNSQASNPSPASTTWLPGPHSCTSNCDDAEARFPARSTLLFPLPPRRGGESSSQPSRSRMLLMRVHLDVIISIPEAHNCAPRTGCFGGKGNAAASHDQIR